jgi:hypothetical protein
MGKKFKIVLGGLAAIGVAKLIFKGIKSGFLFNFSSDSKKRSEHFKDVLDSSNEIEDKVKEMIAILKKRKESSKGEE